MVGSSRSEQTHRHAAYGLLVRTELALPELGCEAGADAEHLARTRLLRSTPEKLADAFSGDGTQRASLSSAEGPVAVTDGRHGDLLLSSDALGEAVVAADGSAVLCAPRDEGSPLWRRFLLDTVLGTAAIRAGLTGLHAAAVSTPHGAVAIAAPSGGGKTTLAAELIGRGAELVTDDLLFLVPSLDAVLAYPGPPVMSLDREQQALAGDGEIVGELTDGLWVKMGRAVRGPVPLALIVWLERGASHPEVRHEPAGPDVLLGCALDAGPSEDRQARRLEVLSQVAAQVPVARLSGPAGCSPAEYASAIGSLLEATTSGS